MLKWIVNYSYKIDSDDAESIDWLRALPFIFIQLGCLLVFFVGCSTAAFMTALGLYVVRLFFIGGFYHRYFSHKTYQTNRFWQFIFALLAGTCVQRGPLWWAAHHRQHHLVADQHLDAHSPVQHGFWWSHIGWFLSRKHYSYSAERVKDLRAYPELVFLDRFDAFMPTVLLVSLFIFGLLLQIYAPQWNTGPWQMVIWGFCISTTALFHSTVTINSLAHIFGKKKYPTKDNSRNNWLLALITLGEGWHNNHHHYPVAARQGFMWWEIDVTYYVLRVMQKLGIIWQIKEVPETVLNARLVK